MNEIEVGDATILGVSVLACIVSLTTLTFIAAICITGCRTRYYYLFLSIIDVTKNGGLVATAVMIFRSAIDSSNTTLLLLNESQLEWIIF